MIVLHEGRKVCNCKICCDGQQKEGEEETEQIHEICYEIL